jgi:hypothetical protein
MRTLTPLLFLFLCSCTHDFADYCRDQTAGLVAWHKSEADRELKHESPNGWYDKPYSRENWDKYWNNIIFHVSKVSPESCNNTYRGPSGTDMVQEILGYRRQLALPDVNLDERNRDKSL